MSLRSMLFTGPKDQVFVDSSERSYQIYAFDRDNEGRLLICGEYADGQGFHVRFENLDDRLATPEEVASFWSNILSHSESGNRLVKMTAVLGHMVSVLEKPSA